MSEINYLGKGMLPCPECHGNGKVKCEKCSGHGKFSTCNNCNSTGNANCSDCDGSGKEVSICPVCNHGKIRKTRWINCSRCHGTGQVKEIVSVKCRTCGRVTTERCFKAFGKCPDCGSRLGFTPVLESCGDCGGRGQVEDIYYEVCPNCHGEYKRKTDKPCKKCDGTGEVKCHRCDGTGHAKCQTCDGSGKVNCEKCGGEGSIFDSAISLKTMQEAAANGDLDALHDLACAYILGTDGLSVNCEKARECFEEILKHEVDDDDDGAEEVVVDSAWTYLKFLPELCNGDAKSMRELANAFSEWDASVMIERCDPVEFWMKRASEVEAKQKEREKDEYNRKMRELDKQRREAERKEMEEQNRKDAAEKAAKERKDAIQGCGCLLAIAAVVGFFIWWWLEGLTMSALPGMWEQAKNALGGNALGTIAKIGGAVGALLIVWSLIKGIKGKKGEVSTSPKKRWKFVVLGILFGFFGIHLAYAKRWLLFLLLWAGFITGNVMSDTKACDDKPTTEIATRQVAPSDKPTKTSTNTISNIGFGVWALLWIGGTLFIKKDGKGNRM